MVYLDHHFKAKWCLEVKWSDRYITRPNELKGLITFIEKNAPQHITVSTKTSSGTVKINNLSTMEFKEAALICFNIGYSSIKDAG